MTVLMINKINKQPIVCVCSQLCQSFQEKMLKAALTCNSYFLLYSFKLHFSRFRWHVNIFIWNNKQKCIYVSQLFILKTFFWLQLFYKFYFIKFRLFDSHLFFFFLFFFIRQLCRPLKNPSQLFTRAGHTVYKTLLHALLLFTKTIVQTWNLSLFQGDAKCCCSAHHYFSDCIYLTNVLLTMATLSPVGHRVKRGKWKMEEKGDDIN